MLVDLPKDVTTAILRRAGAVAEPHLPGYHMREAGHAPARSSAAAEMINRAERPVLYVGGGAILAGARERPARKCAEKANIPVTTTLLGLGAFDERIPLALHMLGMHGIAYANYAVQESDCLIAVGARFDDRVTGNLANFAPAARAAREGRGGIIHIDIAPANISKNVDVDVAVVGDARKNLELLLPLHRAQRAQAEWFAQIDAWKKRSSVPLRDDREPPKPQDVIEEINRQTKGERSSPPAWASTRCGRPSSTALAIRGR